MWVRSAALSDSHVRFTEENVAQLVQLLFTISLLVMLFYFFLIEQTTLRQNKRHILQRLVRELSDSWIIKKHLTYFSVKCNWVTGRNNFLYCLLHTHTHTHAVSKVLFTDPLADLGPLFSSFMSTKVWQTGCNQTLISCLAPNCR